MSEGRKKRRKRKLKWCRFAIMDKNGCTHCAVSCDIGIYCEWQRPCRDADGQIVAKCGCMQPMEVEE